MSSEAWRPHKGEQSGATAMLSMKRSMRDLLLSCCNLPGQ